MAWRYLTDCYTGLRHWHWYVKIGKPLYKLVYPCSRAAVIGLPFIVGPAARRPDVPWVPPVEQGGSWGGTGEAWVPLGGGASIGSGLPIEWPVASPTGEFGPGPLPISPVIGPETPVAGPGGGPGPPEMPVPEPSSLAIMAIGGVLALAGRWAWQKAP